MRPLLPLLLLAGLLPAGDVVPDDAAACAELLDAQAVVERLDHFEPGAWLEGPVWLPEGFLVYSNIPADRLQRWPADAAGSRVFRSPAHAPNGNVVWQDRLLTCEQQTQRLAATHPDGSLATVCERFDGHPFDSPNDLAVAPDGALWFTDPSYGLAGRPASQPVRGVYRCDPASGRAALAVADSDQPNGIGLSPDGRILYVSDSGTPHHIRAFPVAADGGVGTPRIFAVIAPGVPDGLKVDRAGRVWSSAGDGVQIFTGEGRRIATIRVPETTANLCFGGADGRTLFITATTSLYRIALRSAPGR